MDNKKSDKLEEVLRLSVLYDFYGELLGEAKKQIFEDYVFNDFSLSEIAEETGISRQGVHDTVKRCTAKLNEYEDKLHLVEKFEFARQRVNEIKNISAVMHDNGTIEGIDDIVRISEEILNEL